MVGMGIYVLTGCEILVFIDGIVNAAKYISILKTAIAFNKLYPKI